MTGSILSSKAEQGLACLSAQNYSFLQRFIYGESGIVLDADKQYLLDSRLLPIVRDANLASLNELSELLYSKPTHTLGRLVVDAMTTNETLFFRDRIFFEALRNTVLPDLFTRAWGRKVRILSAAASTGQEAYSLAMMMLDLGKSASQFEIVGTDISSRALDKARAGRYIDFEISRGLPPAMLTKYFSASGSDWVIHPEIRSQVTFRQMDLRNDLQSLGNFDLILCRNVLIYFDDQTKQAVFANLGSRLEPWAYLALGCSETILRLPERYTRQTVDQASFYKMSGK
jgi:chemotaxis protein methyltransferase CheR